MLRFTSAALLALSAVALPQTALAQSIQTPLSGLAGPMHIDRLDESVFGPGWILITEAGSGNDDGAIRAFNVDTGESHVVVSDLPAVIAEGFPLGAAQAKFDDSGVLYVAMSNVGPQPGSNGVLRFDTQSIGWSFNTPPMTIADATIIDVQTFSLTITNEPNLFDLELGDNGLLYILDAGANAILTYDQNTATFGVLVTLPSVPNNSGIGPPQSDPVPTALERAGDDLLISTLTGFPFNPGVATLYRVDPQGNLSVEYTGLSVITDVAVDPTDGDIAVAQFASFELPAGWNPNGGQVSKLTSAGLVPMATNLQFPTSVVYDAAGSIYTGSLTLGHLNKIVPGVLPYCEGAPNSVSVDGASMAHTGTTSIAANDLTVSCSNLPSNAAGIYFYGFTPASYPLGNGTLCIGYPDLVRLGVTQADAGGMSSFSLDTAAMGAMGPLEAGAVLQIQHWYRDPSAGGMGFNLSNALQVLFGN